MKLVGRKSALNPQVFYSTDRSTAVVSVLVLLFVALWFILRGDLFYEAPCVILFLCFSVFFSIANTPLGEQRANRSICACLVLSVSFSSLCLGRAPACDCDTPWTFLLSFFLYYCRICP